LAIISYPTRARGIINYHLYVTIEQAKQKVFHEDKRHDGELRFSAQSKREKRQRLENRS